MINADQLMQNEVQAFQTISQSIDNSLHVCMPGFVIGYDKHMQTVNVRLAIKGILSGQLHEYPVLTDVPVFFFGGRDFSITYEVSVGDECLVVFGDSCIDGWFHRGDVQNPYIERKHDLSDGSALIGFRSKPNAVPINDDKPFAVRMRVGNDWKTPLWIDKDGFVHVQGGAVNG